MHRFYHYRSAIALLIVGGMALAGISLAPTAAAQTVESRPSTQAPVVHVIRAGDALSMIAEEYGVSVEQIVDANGLQDRHLIRIGQELIIPSAAVATPSPAATDDEPTPAERLLACPQNTESL